MDDIILTSAGFSNPIFMELVRKYFHGDCAGKNAAIITTASEDKEKNDFALLAEEQLRDMSFEEIKFFDIEKQDPGRLLDFDVIYVNGGNTYYLLYWTVISGFDAVVREFVEKGGLYIGVSAGSIIAGPSIEVLNYTKGDPNEVGLTDFSAIGLTDKAIVPHYSEEKETAVAEYEQACGIEVIRLEDGTAWVGESPTGEFRILA